MKTEHIIHQQSSYFDSIYTIRSFSAPATVSESARQKTFITYRRGIVSFARIASHSFDFLFFFSSSFSFPRAHERVKYGRDKSTLKIFFFFFIKRERKWDWMRVSCTRDSIDGRSTISFLFLFLVEKYRNTYFHQCIVLHREE